MTTLSIRIEEKTKRDASKALTSLGLDLSSAVKMFLNQVIVEQGIPFKPSLSPSKIREAWDKDVAHALSHGKKYSDVGTMFSDITKK